MRLQGTLPQVGLILASTGRGGLTFLNKMFPLRFSAFLAHQYHRRTTLWRLMTKTPEENFF
jgi:hypothetical protein